MYKYDASVRQPNSGLVESVRLVGGARRPALFDAISHRRLTWWPEIGVGYYPVEAGHAPYGRAYFDRFADQADSDIGRALMQSRVKFIDRHHFGPLVDVGIGCGAFIEARNAVAVALPDPPRTSGYDVNRAGIEWLSARGLLRDPYMSPVDAVSLWDVLEHIPDFPRLLANIREWCFVSLPIFRDGEHVLRSKHYRKDEHVWYFTADGLIAVMHDLGFVCVDQHDEETRIGREDIGSFAFRRKR